VGKTELAKTLTQLIFGDDRAYIRFDMSEFAEEHSGARLLGAPPGYIGYDAGGELTNAVRDKPFAVVLFDEIEKAHPRILDKFLQILDDGRLTDGRGETAYFSEAILVFTSNLGIYVEDEHGKRVQSVHPGDPQDVVEARVRGAIEDYFKFRLSRPEILNRIGDNIVVFGFITPDVGAQIFDGMLRNVVAACARSTSSTSWWPNPCASSCGSCAFGISPTAVAASAISWNRCSSSALARAVPAAAGGARRRNGHRADRRRESRDDGDAGMKRVPAATLELNKAHWPVTVLGPGRRIGLWVQGCTIHCRGCVSQDTWPRDPAKAIAVAKLLDWCRRVVPEGPEGITISGGEPFEQPRGLRALLEGSPLEDDAHLDFDVLCYSGYPLARLQRDHAPLLALLDAIIPEPYAETRPSPTSARLGQSTAGAAVGAGTRALAPMSTSRRRRRQEDAGASKAVASG